MNWMGKFFSLSVGIIENHDVCLLIWTIIRNKPQTFRFSILYSILAFIMDNKACSLLSILLRYNMPCVQFKWHHTLWQFHDKQKSHRHHDLGSILASMHYDYYYDFPKLITRPCSQSHHPVQIVKPDSTRRDIANNAYAQSFKLSIKQHGWFQAR